MRTNQLTDTRGKWSWCYRFAVIQFHPWPFSNKLFLRAFSILLWLIMDDFLQATKLNCQKCYVFSNANTLLFSHETCRSSNSSHSLTFLYRLGSRDRKKRIVLNIEQWKNERKVVWNLSEFVKTIMITHNKGEWPTCLALTSVAEQFSN